jgi:large subunit ribosomal protein L25
MKSIEIIGYKRANLGKKDSKALREDAQVPCVLYGGPEQIHFSVPAFQFRELVYTPEANMVDLNIDGTIRKVILQDIQFHPVNDMILHADFLELDEAKPVRMEIPIRTEGASIGVAKGGKLTVIMRKLKVLALPANMPDFVSVNIADLDLGRSIKVSAIPASGYAILNPKSNPVVSIVVPRALKSAKGQNQD